MGGRQQPIRRRRPAGLRVCHPERGVQVRLADHVQVPSEVLLHRLVESLLIVVSPIPGATLGVLQPLPERVVDEDGLLVPEPLVLVVEQVPLLEHVLHLVRDHAVTPVRLVASLRIGSLPFRPASPGVEHDALHLAAQPQVPLRLYRRPLRLVPLRLPGPQVAFLAHRPGVGCFIPGLFGREPEKDKEIRPGIVGRHDPPLLRPTHGKSS